MYDCEHTHTHICSRHTDTNTHTNTQVDVWTEKPPLLLLYVALLPFSHWSYYMEAGMAVVMTAGGQRGNFLKNGKK